MKKIMLIILAAGAAVAGASAADAAGGCGAGYHRGPNGHCRLNRGVVVVAPRAPAVGIFYTGRGYWDGHRYRQHRYRWHNGWRYR